MGWRGEGLRLLSPQLTSDPHLIRKTGGATRIISRETSCQVQPGRGPGSRGCRVPPPSDPGALSSSQDPGVPAPSSFPQESGPASEPRQLTMGHYICAFQVVSGSEWKERVWGWKRACVPLQGKRQVGPRCSGNHRFAGRVPRLVQPWLATPLPSTFIIQLWDMGD